MPAPQNLDQFLGLIRKSGLVESERLDSFLHEINLDLSPDSPVDIKEFSQLLLRAGMLSQFQSEQLLQGKWRGFSIGKYRVLERLGSGGMGNVYLCEHLTMCHKVAVKVLPTAKNNDPAALGRFYREARAAGVLDHPNLVRAFDIDQDGDLHFLVMEYVDGINLQQLVIRQRRPLNISRACHYIYQATQGLEHAFKAGLVHRDIKPANILLDRSGTVRILDMGLARFFNDNEDLLTLKYDDKNVLGTADYLSPEQATDSHNVDIRSDIYSLGATFYFLLSGQALFPEGKVAQKLIWHQTRPHRPLVELRPDVPIELSTLLDRMLAKEPRQRFQTPAALLVALEPWVQVPIDPPAEEEIPRLSLAARVTSTPEIELPSRAGLQRRNLEVEARPFENSPTGRRRSDVAVVTPRRLVSVNENTPPVLATERAPVREHSSPALSATPAPAVVAISAVAVKPEPLPLWKRRAGLVLFCALVFGVGGGLGLRWAYIALFANPTPVTAQQRVLVVSRSGHPDTFATLAQAIQAARPQDRIEIREDQWEETLVLDSSMPEGLTIEGAAPNGKPVVWRAANGKAETEPLVRLRGVNKLRLSRLVLDGQDQAHVLIRLEKTCPGLVLEELHLKDARRTALHGLDCAGSAATPLVIQNVRITSRHALESGIQLEARSGQTTSHVHIKDSRFEGMAQAGITVQGATESVEFTRNRIYNVLDGLHFTASAAPQNWRVVIMSNTFREIQRAAIHFDQLPTLESSQVRIEKNLFQRVAALTLVDNFSAMPEQSSARWIGSDNESSMVETIYFRRSFVLTDTIESATLDLAGATSGSVWINNQPLGQIEYNATTRRVSSFDVTRRLVAGTNVIAVQLQGRRSLALLAELQVRLRGGKTLQIVSDREWRTNVQAPTAWQQVSFNDQSWPGVRLESVERLPAEFEHPIWERLVRDRLKGRAAQLFLTPTGNVRDSASKERYPALESVLVDFQLPTETSDDRRFLRYAPGSPLTNHGSPGVGP